MTAVAVTLVGATKGTESGFNEMLIFSVVFGVVFFVVVKITGKLEAN